MLDAGSFKYKQNVYMHVNIKSFQIYKRKLQTCIFPEQEVTSGHKGVIDSLSIQLHLPR
jgi:hypothetical protein